MEGCETRRESTELRDGDRLHHQLLSKLGQVPLPPCASIFPADSEAAGPLRPGNMSMILPGTAETEVQEASKSDSAQLNPSLPTIWFGSHYKVSVVLLRKYQVKSNLPHSHTGSLMTGLRRKNSDRCQHTIHLECQLFL